LARRRSCPKVNARRYISLVPISGNSSGVGHPIALILLPVLNHTVVGVGLDGSDE